MENRKKIEECENACNFFEYLRKSQCTKVKLSSFCDTSLRGTFKVKECEKVLQEMNEKARECITLSLKRT